MYVIKIRDLYVAGVSETGTALTLRQRDADRFTDSERSLITDAALVLLLGSAARFVRLTPSRRGVNAVDPRD